MVGQVARKNFDTSVAGVAFSAQRVKFVDFTKTVGESSTAIFIMRPREIANLDSYTKQFMVYIIIDR